MGEMKRCHGRPRKKKTAACRLTLLILALVATVGSGIRAAQILAEDHAGALCAERMRSYVQPAAGPAAKAADPGSGPGEDEGTEGPADVDFGGLSEAAPDVRGWIRIPGTEVDYPVMQGPDNAYYLSHNSDGTENRAGSIFLDAWNSPDFSDLNTVVYGHRMNDGSMFASLHKLTDQEYLERFHRIHITSAAGEKLTYEIFCTEFVAADASGPAYRMTFGDGAEYAAWLSRARGGLRSVRPVQLHAEDKVLTLSTCIRGDPARRLAVQAYLAEKDGTYVHHEEGEGTPAFSLNSSRF